MFTLDDDIMRQLRATFKVEAAEHIQAMNRVLLALEGNPEGDERAALLEEIFREAHSLKGAAGAADFPEVEATAHKLENVFGVARGGKIKLTRDLCDVLYAGVDAVSIIVEAALAEKPHELDLPSLHARLDAAERGEVVPVAAPPPVAAVEPSQAPAVPPAAVAAPPPVAVVEPSQAPAVPPAAVAAPPPVAAVEPSQAPAVPPAAVAAPSAVPQATPSAPVQPSEGGARPKPTPSEPKSPERKKTTGMGAVVEDTIRVGTSKIDSLMARSGELLVAGLKIDQRLHELAEINHSIEDWNREWLKAKSAHSTLFHDSDSETLRPLIRLLDLNQERLKNLAIQVGELHRGFAGDALHLARVTNDLGEGVMKVRMLPVSTVFDAFPRLVRDLARENGKEVELQMEGTETELDRKVLEEIRDPLIHLLRNAVDHGIEKPEARLKAGKPARGNITLKAFQKGNSIVIEASDDGGGINRDKVRQVAVKNGLLTPDEADALSNDEAIQLIFTPGFSTSPTVTGTSGRGVGMDVVRRNVEALQGLVDVESVFGQGTTIALTLPLTLATTQELLVQVGDQTYGIPIAAVERILRISPKDIASVAGRRAIVVDSEPVSLVRLAEVLERPNAEQQVGADEKMPAVILGSARRRIAFLVDNVVGQQESVIKGLGKQLARVRNVAGATILGSGQVIMVLNPVDLMKSVRGSVSRVVAAPQVSAATAKTKKVKQSSVLVVDDSLSTRTLEKSILETAGYRVTVATDGVEALSLLRSNGSVDLIVSDVLMPHMDGLELTATVKKDPNLKKIPVVLVTSLDSQADRERGLEVGADAYIVKSKFDQSNLLETIAQLV